VPKVQIANGKCLVKIIKLGFIENVNNIVLLETPRRKIVTRFVADKNKEKLLEIAPEKPQQSILTAMLPPKIPLKQIEIRVSNHKP